MEAAENQSNTVAQPCSQAPSPRKSQSPGGETRKGGPKTSESLGSGGSAENTRENGVRVSINGKDGKEDAVDVWSDGVAEVTTKKVVETEIAIEQSFEGQAVEVLTAKEADSEDSLMNGVTSLLKMRGSATEPEVKRGSEKESLQGLSFVLGIGKNEEGPIEKELAGHVVLNADGASRKTANIDVNGNGDLGKEENVVTLKENTEEPEKRKGQARENEEDDKEDDEMSDDEHQFCVGDFVWGKIKSHPWWPGQIYDPLDASEYADKVKQKNRLLVAYFGDGTFAWCHPSQLKPMQENFEEMSRQSSSKNFLNAVHNAVDTIGRLVELKMTSAFVPKENSIGLERPRAMNGGIKDGVFVPVGGLEKLISTFFEPVQLLEKIGLIAKVISVTNVLELTMLKGWLSSFYHSKGGYNLAMYDEPQPIPGLEDKSKALVNTGDYNNSTDIPNQVPVEEHWLSSPIGPKVNVTSQSLSQDYPWYSEHKVRRIRKEKSIAEIIKGNVDAEAYLEEHGVGSAKTKSGRRKKKGSDDADANRGEDSASVPRKRKESKLSGALTAQDGRVSSAEKDGGGTEKNNGGSTSTRGRKKRRTDSVESDSVQGKEETSGSPVSRKRKLKVSGGRSDDAKADIQIEKGNSSRERKKSKYLSPPYTNLSRSQSKKDMEAESLKISNEAQLAKRMTRAASHLMLSPPIGKCSTEILPQKQSGEAVPGHEASNEPTVQAIDPMEVKATANEVLSGIRSAALVPQVGGENSSFEKVGEFLSVYRSSVYRNGSHYKTYNKSGSARKGKSVESEPGSLKKDQKQPDGSSSGQKSKQAKMRKSEAKSHKLKIKPVADVSDGKENDKDSDEKSSPAAALFVLFGPGSSLPKRDDLLRIYGKYGPLSKDETDMFYTNFCARVVFMRSSDAEDAFNSSQLASPFGTAKVSFKLRYLSAECKTRELKEIPIADISPAKGKGKSSEKPYGSELPGGGSAQMKNIKWELEYMISMLDKSDGKMSQEMKSKLEGQIKVVLEKVSSMDVTSS